MLRPFASWVVSVALPRCNRRTTRRPARATNAGPRPGTIFPDLARAARAVALPRHHARGVAATPAAQHRRAAGLLLAVLGLALPALAQPTAPPPAKALAPAIQPDIARDPTLPPLPDRAMALYALLEGWVRAGAAQPAALPEEPAGVSITLRLAGQVVGRGLEVGGAPGAFARAAQAAIEEANRRMPIERDALREEAMKDARARLCISLELSGALIPYAPELYDQVDLEVQAGVEGVAARRGERVSAVFPAAMLANNAGPGGGLASAIAEVTEDPSLAIRIAGESQPGPVSKKHGLTLYRFRTTHLAQTGPGRPPVFLFRGGRVIPGSEINSAMLREFADGMARNLLARKWPGEEPLGLLGTNWPALGRFEPVSASPFERALSAVALQRYLGARAGADAVFEQSLDELIETLMASVAATHLEKKDLAPATAALCEIVLMERRPAAGRTGPELAFEVYVKRVVDEAAANAASPPAERAVIAWALARRAERTRDSAHIAAADAHIRGVFRDTPPALLTSQMPWLGWAELSLTRARGDGEVKSGPALREMREQLWKHQLTAADCGADGPDLVGGIVFTGPRNPLPSASCLRPLAFAASMLGEPGLTSAEELPKELSRLLAALRFARQLAADEATGFMYQEPARAMWGIRSAVWDQRQTPEATAIGLLLVAETLESLEARAGGAPPRPGSPKTP